MKALEANFDGLVGPTHNFAGLAFGNVASDVNRNQVSNPREAALQGLAKMKSLKDLGFVQGILPPQERPSLTDLRALGFSGADAEVIARAAKDSFSIFVAACSASSMWSANAATVSPSADTADGRVHFTPANLHYNFHRSLEHRQTARTLRAIFADERYFAHHAALPAQPLFSDEGAANHTRLCQEYGEPGVAFFVYGREAGKGGTTAPSRYPARQTLEASQAIARQHGLPDEAVVFAQQNPLAIDQGVFHNDVIAVGNRDLLLYHEEAFLDSEAVIDSLHAALARRQGTLKTLKVGREQLSIEDAVSSYLFNSQLLSRPDGQVLLLAPEECRSNERVLGYLDGLVADGRLIQEVRYLDVRQSMRNGGGPACLRLRVVLNEPEIAAIRTRSLLDEGLYAELRRWVNTHYRDQLKLEDLADPHFLTETRTALDELTSIMRLGSIYDFQR